MTIYAWPMRVHISIHAYIFTSIYQYLDIFGVGGAPSPNGNLVAGESILTCLVWGKYIDVFGPLLMESGMIQDVLVGGKDERGFI